MTVFPANDSGGGTESTLFDTVNPLAETATTCDGGTGTDTTDGVLCALAESWNYHPDDGLDLIITHAG